jgi:molybdate transport system substrate-binding protein
VRPVRSFRSLLVIGLFWGLPSACTKGTKPETIRLTAFAASSLRDVFPELGRDFERTHPGVEIAFQFGGSQILRLQLQEGAEADLFASADQAHVRDLEARAILNPAVPFARNRLAVITPRDGDPKILSLRDLVLAKRLVVGEASSPIGAYTEQLLQRAGQEYGQAFLTQIRSHIVSEESNVRLVRAKVELGEADAAVVYQSDTVQLKGIRTIPIPDELNVKATYFVGTTKHTPRHETADAWLDALLSPEGRETLEAFGFEVPK